MTILASEILTNVRNTLSDVDKVRYTDARLLKFLNDAMNDIAKNSTLLIDTKFVIVSNNVVDYDLSTLMIKLLRVELNDEAVPFKSFEEMDAYGADWQLEKGNTVKAIVYSTQSAGNFKLYPVPENVVNDHISYSSAFGIMTAISYSDILPIIADSEGDLASYPDDAMLKLYYIRKHEKVDALTDELDIDENTSVAIEHYIAGFAFRDNHDSQNRALGAEELKIYASMMEQYSIQRFNSFTQSELIATYNPMGS